MTATNKTDDNDKISVNNQQKITDNELLRPPPI